MAIDPRGADLKRYLQEDPGGSVVMLNLLRFAEGGRESYDQYAKALSETFLPRYGGEVLYAGDGGTPLVACATMRARRGAPSSLARRSDITTSAAAPSLTGGALPAVTVPPS